MFLFMFRPGTKVIAMTRKATRRRPKGIPQLLKHRVRAKVYAYALFDGTRHSYGAFDDEAKTLFAADLEAWKANGCRWPEKPEPQPEPSVEQLSVEQLCEAYVAFLRSEHPSPKWWKDNGGRTEGALDALKHQFGGLSADDFGKLEFAQLRDHLHDLRQADKVTAKLARATVTERLRVVRNAFEWAATADRISGVNVPAIETAHRALAKLKRGRGKRKRKPVERWVVEATLPYLTTPTRALIELMWWTPVRPSELFGLRPKDIDQSEGDVWLVECEEHKTEGHEVERTIKLGPKCIETLRPLMLRPAGRPLFSPKESVAEVRRRRREARETPLWPSHVDASRKAYAKANGQERPRQGIGDVYTKDTLRRAVHRAVDRANRDRAAKELPLLPKWNPYDARHAALTRLAKEHGRDGARAAADHKESSTTDRYCHESRAVGIEVARKSS